jgi:hypothetical protein
MVPILPLRETLQRPRPLNLRVLRLIRLLGGCNPAPGTENTRFSPVAKDRPIETKNKRRGTRYCGLRSRRNHIPNMQLNANTRTTHRVEASHG